MAIMISGVESDKYWNIVVEQCGVKYVLMSYHYMKSKPKDFLKKRLEKHPDVKVFIDSGTFTFVQKMDEYKDKPDSFWEKYMTEYTEWVRYNKEHIFACADLDLDILVGTEKVDEWRKKYFEPLQKEGIEVCYIWHEERGMQGWEEMCRRYPYVGLSTENADFTLQKLMRMLNIAKKYNSRVHGMATTKTDLLVRVPFFSCDSSVDGNSSIVVKDLKTNGVERLTIKELYDRKTDDEFRTTHYETRVPYSDYEVLTVDNSNKVVWGELYGVVKHKVKKPTVQLNIEGGRSIICTTDHSIIVMDKGGNLVEIEADKLKVGDYVLAPRGYNTNNPHTSYVDVLITKPNSQKEEKINQRVELTDSFLQFLGLWVGDGHCNGGTIGLSCYHDVECRRVIDSIATLYGATVTIRKNNVDAYISNVTLQRIMKELGFQGNSQTKRIPKIIYSLSAEQICQFLRGYFSADGTGSCECSTVSEELKNDLVELLEMLNINCSVSYTPSGAYNIKGKVRVKRESWHITIRDRRSKELFANLIGFLQEYKNLALHSLLENTPIRGAKREGIPKGLAVKDSFRTDSLHTVRVESHNGRIHRKYSYVFNERVADAELNFLQIKSIEIVNKDTEEVEVYDLSVRDYERFFANGILVHNTTWIVGQQYGELNWFDGRSMKRLSKQQWRRNYKTQLLKPPFNADWDLLINGMGGRGDTYELLRLNVLAFVIAEEHIRKRLGKKMYWLSGEVGTAVPVRDISEVMLPPKEWFNNGLQDDYINYLEELNLPTTIEKQEALDLLWEYYIHVNRDDEELERSEDEVLFNFCKIVLKEEVGDREEALDMIHQYYVDNATGNRTDVIESYEQEEVVENNRPKERKDYITESDFEVIDLSPNDMETLALPAPREDMPEVDEYDEILRQNDIVPVRDERGRFIKGQKKVRKPKSVYSDKYPKLACDTCYKSGDCPDYRPGYVCAFHKMFKRFDTRDLNDVVDAMQSMANSNLERMQRAMMFEIMDGGMVTPEVTGLIDQNMRLLSQMKELLTYAPKTVLQQKRIVREDGTEETITQMNVNPSQGGILSKIFGGNAPSKEEEAIDAEFTVEKE